MPSGSSAGDNDVQRIRHVGKVEDERLVQMFNREISESFASGD
jgi:hypothetical protein